MKIDEQAYRDGQTAFAKGETLRQLFEPRWAKKKDPNRDWEKDEEYFNGLTMGFADALLAKLRSR